MSGLIERSAGRSTFGGDPAAYARARPGYPDALYDVLRDVCGLAPGTATFEIGPGPGTATEKLLAMGAKPLVAIEADPRFVELLRAAFAASTLNVVGAPFDEAALPDAAFDLGVSATAFHWLEQAAALAKVRTLLRPSGWWSMWWNVYHDPARHTEFDLAIGPLLRGLKRSPAGGEMQFAMDAPARLSDLAAAGFSAAQSYRFDRLVHRTTADVVALFATFSPVLVLSNDERHRFLDGLADIVDRQFNGRIEQPLLTTFYAAQNRAQSS